MPFHFALLALLQPPIYIGHHPFFHPTATHLLHPSAHNSRTLRFLDSSICSSPPTAPTPLAASRPPGTTSPSAHSPNMPKSSRSPCNPAPDTCATEPPPSASPAACRLH